jgi:demethylmenaquinone methyltransferase/2-methoxy-6-polyprenyl-1,4-benzoquinol methylase
MGQRRRAEHSQRPSPGEAFSGQTEGIADRRAEEDAGESVRPIRWRFEPLVSRWFHGVEIGTGSSRTEPFLNGAMDTTTPEIVASACARAKAARFELSCEPEVGALLAVLAGAVPPNGRILDMGTGAGVGLAWLVHGLRSRDDVEVVTIDVDSDIQEIARRGAWPAFVRFLLGDAAELVGGLGKFDLIFADAPGGKLFKLRRTIDALEPRGVLVVDDMDLERHDDPALRQALVVVRDRLLSNPDLLVAELHAGSGIMVAVRSGQGA